MYKGKLCAAFCLGASFLRFLYGVPSKNIALAWCNFMCDQCGKMIASATTMKNHISTKSHFSRGRGGSRRGVENAQTVQRVKRHFLGGQGKEGAICLTYIRT